MSLRGKVAFITGASRGVGKALALALAKEGCDVVVAGRAPESGSELPGTIHDTAREVEELGARALPVPLDVREDIEVHEGVEAAINTFGRIDILVNNAGALHWRSMLETSMERFDLLMSVNARAAFAVTRAVLPHMIENEWGHILMMSPPLIGEAASRKIAYCISKYGMTLVACGLAQEVRQHNVACNALWPATLIESPTTEAHGLGGPAMWRKPAILCDAARAIFAREPRTFTGKSLIDEDFLRGEGVSDFSVYRCDPATEPPRIGMGFKMEAGPVD